MKRPVESELSRELSLFHITMLGVGMMIGAGVFVTTGIGIGIAGPGGILLAFALNGLLAFLSVMTYAELASAMPHAGAGYSYVQRSIGGFTGFFSGWISWFGHAVAGSLYAITFSKYVLHFLSKFDTLTWLNTNLPMYEKVVAVLAALVFVYINYRGASETGNMGAAIAIGQTVVLCIIGIAGIAVAVIHPDRMANFDPFLPNGWGKVLVVMGLSLVGYEGYEVIANTAEEAVDAKRNVPKGMFYAAIIVISTYLLVAFGAIVGLSVSGVSVVAWFSQHGALGFAGAISRLIPFGGLLVTLAAIFASTSALNATVYSSTRICFALGRDGYLPTSLSRISRKTRTPHVALLFSGAITVSCAAFFPVEVVCAGASLFFIVLFNLVAVAAIKARQEHRDTSSYGYLMPFFPLIPFVSFVGRLVIGVYLVLVDMGATAYIIAGVWVGAGTILYFSYSKSRATDGREHKVLAPDHVDVAPDAYQVMLPVSNPQTASVLVKYASLIAAEDDAELVITSVVTVPYATPLEEAETFTQGARDLVTRTAELVEDEVPVHCIIRYGHNSARAIIGSVREKKPDFLILGWRGYAPREHHTMGSTLDPIIRRAPCDILVVKPDSEDPDREIKSILLPLKEQSAQGSLTVKMVRLLAEKYNARITILHVKKGRKAGTDADGASQIVSEQGDPADCVVRVLWSDDRVSTIIEQSMDHDLVVIGATDSSIYRQFMFGSLAEEIANRCPRTVLMVKERPGFRSHFRRLMGSS